MDVCVSTKKTDVLATHRPSDTPLLESEGFSQNQSTERLCRSTSALTPPHSSAFTQQNVASTLWPKIPIFGAASCASILKCVHVMMFNGSKQCWAGLTDGAQRETGRSHSQPPMRRLQPGGSALAQLQQEESFHSQPAENIIKCCCFSR